MLIDSRVTGREGERNTDVRKRHCSPLAHTPEGDHTGNPVKCPDWDLLVPRATPARAGVWFLIHCVCMGSSGLGRPQRLC